jgi:hypothetical protein
MGKKDALNNPVLDFHQGFKKPDRVEVRRVVNIGERKQIAKIVPNQGVQSIEWSIVHTVPQFQNDIVNPWKLQTGSKQANMFVYWLNVLQGRVTLLWKSVLREHTSDEASLTFINWQKCV